MFSSTNYRKTVFFRYECNMAVKALPLVAFCHQIPFHITYYIAKNIFFPPIIVFPNF